jgi:hypothetical protein
MELIENQNYMVAHRDSSNRRVWVAMKYLGCINNKHLFMSLTDRYDGVICPGDALNGCVREVKK